MEYCKLFVSAKNLVLPPFNNIPRHVWVRQLSTKAPFPCRLRSLVFHPDNRRTTARSLPFPTRWCYYQTAARTSFAFREDLLHLLLHLLFALTGSDDRLGRRLQKHRRARTPRTHCVPFLLGPVAAGFASRRGEMYPHYSIFTAHY